MGGLAFGVAFYLLLAHWLPATLHGLIGLGALIGAMGVVILVGIAGLQGVVLQRLLAPGRISPLVAVPAVWTTAEFLVARAGPVAFPWTPLGLALAPVPVLAAPAEWGGVAVLTLWIGAVNGGIAGMVRGWRRYRAEDPGLRTVAGAMDGGTARANRVGWRGRSAVRLAVAVVLLLPAAWGAWRMATLADRDAGEVELTQFRFPRDVLLDPEARDRAAALALSRLAVPGGAPLLLPEAPFASSWEQGAGVPFRDLARARGTPVLAGARFREEGRERNGVVLLDPAGEELLRHGKVRLVPAAEWPATASGPDRGMVDLDRLTGWSGAPALGVLICFETGFGSRSRRLVREGADLLANPTLDGWVRPVIRGPGGGFWSAAHAQHRAHLALRAVETRRGAVRSPVSGELLVVDPSGRIRERRGPDGEMVVTVRPRTTDLRTGFVRFGDLGGVMGLLLLGTLAVISRRTRG